MLGWVNSTILHPAVFIRSLLLVYMVYLDQRYFSDFSSKGTVIYLFLSVEMSLDPEVVCSVFRSAASSLQKYHLRLYYCMILYFLELGTGLGLGINIESRYDE